MPEPSGASSSSSLSRSSSGSGRFNPLGPHVVLASALILVLVLMNVLVLAANNPNRKQGPHYYVAAGDSLSFGYQPNDDFIHGFADDLAAELRQAELSNSKGQQSVEINLANYACAGETTTTMLTGDCPFRNFLKEPYICLSQPNCPQIDAVVNFLEAHKGNVSPVTFELGANDVFGDFDATSCSVLPSGDADLKTMDDNLTRIDTANPDDPTNPKNGILKRLTDALRVIPPAGPPLIAGDLVMLNYYNPFAKVCSNSVDFIHTLNDHLAKDAATFRIPLVDVYGKFGGDANMKANVCTYTWMCNAHPDIHPTTTGYLQIAQAVEAVLGYPHPVALPAAQP